MGSWQVYLTLLLLITAFVLLSFVLVFLLKKARRIAYLRKQKALRSRFYSLYHLAPGLLEGYEFELRRGALVRPGLMRLEAPYWEHANKNGERDRRFSDNFLSIPSSHIDIDDWRIFCADADDCRNAEKVYWVALALRRRGHAIEMHDLEKDKAMHERMCRQDCHSLASAQAIARRFAGRPWDFEGLVAEAFRRRGWKAELTPKTNDGGFDIRLAGGGMRAIVECKCFNPSGSSIGRPLLQKLVGANVAEFADQMYFVTTGYFSKQALSFAADPDLNLRLVDGDALVRLFKETGLAAGFDVGDSMPSDYELGRLDAVDFEKLLPPDCRRGAAFDEAPSTSL